MWTQFYDPDSKELTHGNPFSELNKLREKKKKVENLPLRHHDEYAHDVTY